jgi:hypothetical protein
MANHVPSPLVHHLSWGKLVIDTVGTGQDFKLFPGGGREWDWSETGTHHRPGVQVADITELLDHGSELIVLSRGMHSMLHTCPEVFEHLHAKKIGVFVAETAFAVEIYNSLASKGARVGGLFHSTC